MNPLSRGVTRALHISDQTFRWRIRYGAQQALDISLLIDVPRGKW
jgi:hypothetical protein